MLNITNTNYVQFWVDGILITCELIQTDAGKYQWFTSDGSEFVPMDFSEPSETAEEAFSALDVTYPPERYGRKYL